MNQIDGDTFGVFGIVIGLIVGVFFLKVFLFVFVGFIFTTISAIVIQMLRFTSFIWIPIIVYGAKGWWLFTKGAAIAILVVGFLFIIGQGQRVIDGYHVAVNRGVPVVAAGFHKVKSYVVTETVAAPTKRR